MSSALTIEPRTLLLAALREPAGIATLEIRELDLLLRLARRARLLARLGSALAKSGALADLPSHATDQFNGAVAVAESRHRVARWELDRIRWALSGMQPKKIVAMKGCAYLLAGMPNAESRVFADVDLLLKKDDLQEAEDLLLAAGWISTKITPYDQRYYRRWTHELPPLVHAEREVEVDLHHNILPPTSRLKPPAGPLIEAAQIVPDSPYVIPSDTDIVLHAMAHLMFDSDMTDCLRDLVDIVDLMEHGAGADEAFWPRLLDRALELDLCRPVFYAIRYAVRLLNAEVPTDVMRRSEEWRPPRLIVRLMDTIVPDALFPPDPDRPGRRAAISRLLLYMRSHWIRMPPYLLAYHLSYKFVATRLSRTGQTDENED